VKHAGKVENATKQLENATKKPNCTHARVCKTLGPRLSKK
jgi:hypothetical protein